MVEAWGSLVVLADVLVALLLLGQALLVGALGLLDGGLELF